MLYILQLRLPPGAALPAPLRTGTAALETEERWTLSAAARTGELPPLSPRAHRLRETVAALEQRDSADEASLAANLAVATAGVAAVVAVATVALTMLQQTIHGVCDLVDHRPVILAADTMPFYSGLTFQRFARQWGIAPKRQRTVKMTAGEITAVDFGTLLEGDANSDDCVDILDFYVLKDTFNSSDARADFNLDGVVNIYDYYPIKWNFGRCGNTGAE